MQRNDQHGQPIPDDLVVLPDFKTLFHKAISVVLDARWYEANGCLLMASVSEIEGLSEIDPGIDLAAAEIMFIDEPLKRWSQEDGFYHA